MTKTLTWYLGIDWDNDGTYTEETANLVGLSTRRGREYFLKSNGAGFEPVMVGEMLATLNNLDGRYDPYNSSSPIYPNVLPGAKFMLQVTYGVTTYDVMRGEIADIAPVGGATERVKLLGYDGGEYLRNVGVLTTLQENIYVHAAIEAVLTAANWDGGTALDTWTDVIPYWWASGRSAAKEIDDLNDAAIGQFYIAADGTAKYYSRLRSKSVVETITEAEILKGIDLPQPWEVVRNDVSMFVRTRVLQTSGDLWSLDDKPLVRAGESLSLWVQFQFDNDDVPAKNVINPAATTDYTMYSTPSGGTNLTANFTVTPTIYADRAKLAISNGGAVDGYITLLKIRGQALSASLVQLNQQDSASIARYRKREFKIDNNWLQTISIATDMLGLISGALDEPMVYPTVRLVDQPTLQFTPDLFSLVGLNLPSKDISGYYDLAYIQHDWLTGTGDLVQTMFRFEERVMANNYWFFPTQIGISSKFGA